MIRPMIQRSVAATLVLIGVLLVFWGALYLGERAVRPAGMAPPASIQIQPLGEDGTPDLSQPPVVASYLPDPIYRALPGEGGERAEFIIRFTHDPSGTDLAFFIGATPGLQEIRLNGTVLQPNVPRDTLRGAADGRAFYYMLPDTLLRPGQNRIEIFVERQSTMLVLAPFHIGPAVEAARAAGMVDLITRNVPIIAISFLIFAALLVSVTNWPAEDRARIATLVILLGLWAARTWFITFQTPFEVPFLITSCLYYLLETSLILAVARHLMTGEGAHGRWSRWLLWFWGAVAVYLVAITVAGFQVGPAIRNWFRAMAIVNAGLLGLVAGIGLPLLAWGVAVRRDRRWIERLALMICLLALAVDGADAALDLAVPLAPELALTFYLAAPAGLLLGLGVVASIAREASEARRTVIEANTILADRLDQQSQELSRSYEAQRQMLERQVTLEERQRIVRDIHDGIGGQLLGLMMQVRRGKVDQEAVSQGLQESILDLRLIVDSMDTSEDGLDVALRSFEQRVGPVVEAAGMQFAVTGSLPEGAPVPGPRQTLQILRILQEATSNAIRHSRATRVRLAIQPRGDGSICLAIEDDGQGLPDTVRAGRGLANMRHRAAALDGTLTLEPLDPGTRVSLCLPHGARQT
jgi:signal transduction histidine kinase